MSIKSDKWITRNSELPSHRGADGSFRWSAFDFDEAVPGSWEVVSKDGIVYKPVSETDIVAFHLENPWFPMLAPFHNQQVRSKTVRRRPTDYEMNAMRGKPLDEQQAYFDTLVSEEKAISYGVSSYGYDVQCADEFKVFTNINNSLIDPKNFDPNIFVDVKGPKCIIPPNSFALARTVEWFKIPRNVLTVCLGKSTYARCGIVVNVTPLEPEWEGHVTLEFSNTTTLPAVIYANEGVAQMLFFESDEECAVSYKDRGGKYQGQSGVNVARMK